MKKYLYQSLTKRENFFYFLLLIFPIVFPKYLSSLFDKYINDLIFNNIHSSPLTDFVFLLIGILFIIPCFLKLQFGYHFNRTKIILLFILSFWYLQIRCNIAWSFTSFYYSEAIKYSDVPLMIAGFNILCFLIIEIKRISLKEILAITYLSIFRLKLKSVKRGVILLLRLRRNNNNNTVLNRFIPESINIENEILGRKDYANSIAENIANSYPTEKESYAIAITGKWGSGKTTFLKLIQNELIKKERIIIEFHPWRNHESKNLINNFFDLLNNELGEYDPQLGNKLGLYAKQLASIDDNAYFKSIDFILRTIYGSISTDSLYDEINKAIAKLKKQIVIFIDDLDRLDCQEILEVIRLVRSSSNFKNMVFVVAYDKDFVVKALQKLSNGVNDTFLEKIILAEFNLPAFEEERLYASFKESLISTLGAKYHGEINDYFELQNHYVEGILKKCIFSIRDVTRFANSFKINFQQIESQVLFCDFLNLELIKFKHFEIFQFLKQNYLSLLAKPKSFYPLTSLNKENFDLLWKNNNLRNKEKKNLVETLFLPRNQASSKKVERLIHGNEKPDLDWNVINARSIKVGINYINYFGLRLADVQIGNVEFEKILHLDDEELKNRLDELKRTNQIEQVVQKVLAIYPKNVKDKIHYKQLQKLKIILQTMVDVKYTQLLEGSFCLLFTNQFKTETIEILRECEIKSCLNKIYIIESIWFHNPTNEYINTGYIEKETLISLADEQYLFYFNNCEILPMQLGKMIERITDSGFLSAEKISQYKGEIRKLYDRWSKDEFYDQLLRPYEQYEYAFDKNIYDIFVDENDFEKFISNSYEAQSKHLIKLKNLLKANNWQRVQYKPQ